MSRAAAWLFLAVALVWAPAPTAPQVQIVLQWLGKDGTSSETALEALRDPAALESAMVQAAVAALRAAGLTNLTNESLALELSGLSAGMRAPATSAAPVVTVAPTPVPPREPAEDASVWVPVAVVGAVAVVSLVFVVTLWVFRPFPLRLRAAHPVLPHRIAIA